MRAVSERELGFERLESRILLSAQTGTAFAQAVKAIPLPIGCWPVGDPVDPTDPVDSVDPGDDPIVIDPIDPYPDEPGRYVNWIGDLNGDGLSDFAVGEYDANGLPGAAAIVFGLECGTNLEIDLATLDGTNGFRLVGVNAATVVAVGDVNGDGFDDLLVGSWRDAWSEAAPVQPAVIFGHSDGFAANVDVAALNGHNGFRILTADPATFSSLSLSQAGDLNGDDVGDLIVSVVTADADGLVWEQHQHVMLSQNAGFSPVVDLAALQGAQGFAVPAFDAASVNLSAIGDVNGDGLTDLALTVQSWDEDGASSSVVYVVFGSATGFTGLSDLAALDGVTGFRIVAHEFDSLSVYGVGDVNGDGWDDLGITGFGGGTDGSYSGADFVLFGGALGFAPVIDLATLDGTVGVRSDWSFQYDDTMYAFGGGWTPEMFARGDNGGVAMAMGGMAPGSAGFDPNAWAANYDYGSAYGFFGSRDLWSAWGLNGDGNDDWDSAPIGGRRQKRPA